MEYFDLAEHELVRKGALYTANEISDQPIIWRNTFKKFLSEQKEIDDFRSSALENCNKIILTGAGTSAYIGQSLEGSFLKHTGITTIAVPTTHLVTHASDFLKKDEPTLVISFARSGNSPESVAAVKLVDKICDKCIHFIITCDKEGKLASYHSKNEKFTFILPPETNDKSLAMTSSYTSMLLTGLLFARFEDLNTLQDQVNMLASYGERIINNYSLTLKNLAKTDFRRVVILGSGPLYGTSLESALKLQELTDGQIICKNDTFLAFRHGPKAVIDESTIVLCLFSNRNSVLKYEMDLVRSLSKGKKAMSIIAVSERYMNDPILDIQLIFSESDRNIDDDFLSICSVLPAQMLALFKSLEFGLKPDNPSESGAISRVVEGVIIYED